MDPKMEKCVLELKVVPQAYRTEVADAQIDVIRVRLAAPPDKGKANKELLRFRAKRLGVSKGNLRILSGKTSQRKRLTIYGLSEEKVRWTLLRQPTKK